MGPIVYKRIVQTHTAGDLDDTPDYAVIELDRAQVKRIQRLAKAVKSLNVTYIEEFDCSTLLMNGDAQDPGVVTDKTTPKKAALLINDENPVTALLAKNILAGHKPTSMETLTDIQTTLLTEWDGRTDCDMLKVSNDDFYYHGYIKHTDLSWSTEGIPLSELPDLK